MWNPKEDNQKSVNLNEDNESESKLMNKNKIKKAVFIAELDDIAWILNLRGDDNHESPLFFSYLWISKQETVLFINSNRPEFHIIKE